jgi:hypothetical protein
MSMRKVPIVVVVALLVAVPARAELLRVEIKTLGMD